MTGNKTLSLAALSVRNFVLVDRLDVSFSGGLTALTGETGAGKSILLDALGLVLGGRAETGLIREGAAEAELAAAFHIPDGHPLLSVIADLDIILDNEPLLIRRVLSRDGRNRIFVNDRAISGNGLKTLGEHLADIHGQFDTLGLMQEETGMRLLDSYGGHAAPLLAVQDAYAALAAARRALNAAQAAQDAALKEQDWLQHAVTELRDLGAEVGEEDRLLDQKKRLQNLVQVQTAYGECMEGLDADTGVRMGLHRAARVLERLGDKADAAIIDTVLPQLTAALDAVATAQDALADVILGDGDGLSTEKVEDRLHALRAMARKHQTRPDELPALLTELEGKLGAITDGGKTITRLEKAVQAALAAYRAAAEKLHGLRVTAATKLAKAVNAELQHLRLEKAQFQIDITANDTESADGMDAVRFMASTNPGMPFAPLGKIASGGELSRFMLALKVVLAARLPSRVLVFDEIDAGMGGATAAAIGDRLQSLAQTAQVLIVTHAAQVAARANQHWRVEKFVTKGITHVRLVGLSGTEDRADELARMLAGHTITDEARRAAHSLLLEARKAA